MIHASIPLAMLMLALPVAATGQDGDTLDGVEVAQVSVHERIIIRVPRMSRAAPAPVEWKERKGPKCVAAADMAGALVSDRRNVDIVLSGNRRVRARLERGCGAMDFYSGFYLRPGEDGLVCADRDVIRMRSGGSCEISVFKRLETKR